MEDAPVIGYHGEHHAPPARPRGHRGIHIAAGLAGAATAGYGAYRVGRHGGWHHPFKRAKRLGGKILKRFSRGARRAKAQGLKALPATYRAQKKVRAIGGVGLHGLTFKGWKVVQAAEKA